jgi:hypothetical protein
MLALPKYSKNLACLTLATITTEADEKATQYRNVFAASVVFSEVDLPKVHPRW